VRDVVQGPLGQQRERLGGDADDAASARLLDANVLGGVVEAAVGRLVVGVLDDGLVDELGPGGSCGRDPAAEYIQPPSPLLA
jgi:hypothetical protein